MRQALSGILLVLIVSDFLAHASFFIGILGAFHPLNLIFGWVWERGPATYNLFWSFYWGIAAILLTLILALGKDRESSNKPSERSPEGSREFIAPTHESTADQE